MKTTTLKALSVSCALGISASLQAAPTLYANYAAWSSAVGAQTSTAIPDPAPDLFVLIGSGNASVTYGGVTFSTSSLIGDGAFFNVGSIFSGSPAVLSSQQVAVGVPNILITLSSPVTAFSLNYGYGTFDGNPVTFTLGNGDTFTQPSTGGGYVAADFVGVTDPAPFSTILVTTPDVVLSINNLITAGSGVPEAGSTALLVTVSTLLMGGLKRKMVA